MPFYLSFWEADPDGEVDWVPQGARQTSTWAAVDLRPRGTEGGRCLLWTDVAVVGPDLVELPDLDAGLSNQQAKAVSDALGVANGKIRGHTTRTLTGAVLTDLAADLGVPELPPESDGVRRVRIGGAGAVWDEGRDT